MTDQIESQTQEESDQLTNIDSLNMASLRQYAKLLKISASRDWDKNDYIEAIKATQAGNNETSLVFNETIGPKPGYTRVIMNRDPTPGHANSPIQVGVNGYLLHIPRGIQVDVRNEIVASLLVAKSSTSQQIEGPSNANPVGVYRDEEMLSYPFQVMASTPGGTKWASPVDNRAKVHEQKAAFEKVMGRWPTSGELKEAIKANIIKNTV